MKILFYDAAAYDVESFEKELNHFPDIEIIYHEVDISPRLYHSHRAAMQSVHL